MTAAEAREIVAHPERVIQDHTTENLYNIAEGYLEALEGPEVKALVEALERCSKAKCTFENVEKILTQYREAMKK